MNIATILTGSRDHDLPCKLAWTQPLGRKGHKVFIAGRTKHPNTVYMYEHIPPPYSKEEQNELENWLGLSFRYISSLDQRSFDKRDCSDDRGIEEINQYFSFLTEYFREFYYKYKIDILTIQLESYSWNLIAYYVAKRLGLPIVNLMVSRFPKKGMMFAKGDDSLIWDWNDTPGEIDWNKIEPFYQEKSYVKFEGMGLLSYWSPKNMRDNLSKALQYIGTRRRMVKSVYHEETALMPLSAEIYRAMWATFKGIINPVFWKQPKDEEFFFYPFHFDDDANVTMLEPFTNQIELVQSISRCLPVGVKLYVKPHPAYMGIDIRVSGLLHLSKLPNVTILHPAIPAITLIKKSVAVITLNSTTGFDTMILNKPVISLGHDFYCHPHLVYLVREWDKLPAIISEVYRTKIPRASHDTIKSFVKNIYKNTIFTQGDVAFAEDPLSASDGEKIAVALDKIYKKL